MAVHVALSSATTHDQICIPASEAVLVTINMTSVGVNLMVDLTETFATDSASGASSEDQRRVRSRRAPAGLT